MHDIKKRRLNMSPKTGRPKVENPIAQNLSVRIDAETKKRFLEYCKSKNISQGEAIRKAIELLLKA